MDEIQKLKPGSKAAKAMLAPPSKRERAAIQKAAKRRFAQPEPQIEEEVQVAPARQRAARVPTRQPSRDTSRETGRGGRVVVTGRSGEQLSRSRSATGIDPFHINPEIIPPGWEYQWNAVTVFGNAEVLADQSLTMNEQGWRAVPADRHPGRYMPVGHKGSIIRNGLRLDERPKALSDEARAEDLEAANKLISDRNESLQLTGLRDKMPSGFAMNKRYRGAGGQVNMSIDLGADIPRPQHELEK